MSSVFVLDTTKKPLDPIHPGRARLLLTQQKAAVYRRYPFTIILKTAHPDVQPTPLRLKIDPGSQTTGLALINDQAGVVVWAAELTHRGQDITEALTKRRTQRRSRRYRHTRYHPPRFRNRRRPEGWLPPSLFSRIQNVQTWVKRLCRYAPIGAISQELVRFDTQLMQNAEISGVQYQHGELAGYEVREYVLEKWGRQCAYCGKSKVPLQLEHIVPTSRGGSNRVSNLTLACRPCNIRKGAQTAAEFGYPQIQEQAKRSLKDATAVNVTRWALHRRLQATGLPVEVGTGGHTKWNRTRHGMPKTHWLDAVCVGASTPEQIRWQHIRPLRIRATGRHSRQMRKVNDLGFPIGSPKGASTVLGWQTGDMVRAVVTKGKPTGTYVGRVAVKSDRYFKITGAFGMVEGIHARYCHPLHRSDGYGYAYRAAEITSHT